LNQNKKLLKLFKEFIVKIIPVYITGSNDVFSVSSVAASDVLHVLVTVFLKVDQADFLSALYVFNADNFSDLKVEKALFLADFLSALSVCDQASLKLFFLFSMAETMEVLNLLRAVMIELSLADTAFLTQVVSLAAEDMFGKIRIARISVKIIFFIQKFSLINIGFHQLLDCSISGLIRELFFDYCINIRKFTWCVQIN
jgi:hypothetical protein